MSLFRQLANSSIAERFQNVNGFLKKRRQIESFRSKHLLAKTIICKFDENGNTNLQLKKQNSFPNYENI